MRKHLPLLISGLLIAGCSASGDLGNPFSGSEQNAQLAAYAASSKYPTQQSSAALPVTALVDKDHNDIELLNTGDKPMTNAKVWVNGSFVTPLATLPAHGTVKISHEKFYDATGHSLAKMSNVGITKVELQTDNTLYPTQLAFKGG
jgi:hypothetical protein